MGKKMAVETLNKATSTPSFDDIEARESVPSFGEIGLSPEQPLSPKEAFDRAGLVWDTSLQWQVPINEIDEDFDIITVPKVVDPATSGMGAGDARPYPLAKTFFVRPFLAFADAAIPGARRELLSLAEAQLPEPEFTAPGGLADQIEQSPWYKKLPEAGGWIAEKTVEFKTLGFLFKAVGLSSLFNTIGSKLASRIAGSQIAKIGGKQALLRYGGWNTFRTRVLASIAKTAPENMSFVATWQSTEAARRGEPIGPAAVKGALWGLGFSTVVPLIAEGAKAGMSTKAFEKAALKIQARFPRLADFLAGKPEQEFIDATIESLKEEAVVAGIEVPSNITFSNLTPEAQGIIKGLARQYKKAWSKAVQQDAAAKSRWAAGVEAKAVEGEVPKVPKVVEAKVTPAKPPVKVPKPIVPTKTVNKVADAEISKLQTEATAGSIDPIKAQGDAFKVEDRRAADIAKAQKAELPRKGDQIESPVKPLAEEIDILGGVDPLQQVQKALKEAKAVQPKTELEKKAELKRRIGAAAGALRSNVKKGVPVEEAIFKSTGLLKGPLTEYDQLFTSIEDIIQPAAKDAMYAKIYNHPDLKYLETINTATSFKKLLAGTGLTQGDVDNIERVFGATFKDILSERMKVSSLYDRAVAIWKAGLLTGIKTSGLNMMSNLSHFMTETAKDVPGALIDKATSLITGERALVATTRGTLAGTKEGMKRGWKYLRTGVDERNVGQKLDFKRVNFGTSKFAKGLQMYEESIFHLLGAEDQPFYYGAKARSIFSQAIAKAINKGLTGKERVSFVDNLIQSPTDDMLEAAVHDAEVAVFQNRTGFGDIARAIQKVKGGEIIVPFGRTPSAVATQIINYSPIGPAKEVVQQINKGEFNQRKFSQAFGRGIVGTGVLFIGGLLLKKGLVTLDRPRSERERKLWELEGRKPNSIKIGDKWRSVQVLGPIGNGLVIGGHFQDELEKTGSPTKAIVKAMTGGAKSFSEQTFVRGVNQAVSALVEPERSFENWFSSMAGSVVPTIVSDIARAGDTAERRTEGPFQRVQSRIPVLRESLPPRINVFGQDLPRYGGNVLEVMVDPSRPSKIRNDVVVDELRRLADNGIKVTPTLLGDKHGFDVLTTEENTQLWRRSGEVTYKVLQAFIDNDNYKNLKNDFAKGKAIETLVSKAKAATKAEMVAIKLNQGIGIVKLAESGLLTIQGLQAIQFFGSQEQD